jgi:hypothetical protein
MTSRAIVTGAIVLPLLAGLISWLCGLNLKAVEISWSVGTLSVLPIGP